MAYRIYTERNLADTSRDPDDIVIEELGYKHNLEDAISIAKNYIRTRFFHTDTRLREGKNGSYSATDFCSYGATINIEPIIIT